MISEPNLRAVRSPAGALELFGLLGYDIRQPLTSAGVDFDLTGTVSWVRPTGKRRSGHAVLVAEVDQLPRSLRRFGRLLVENLHDSPLAVIGVRGPEHWSEFYVIRPKLIAGSGGAVSVAKLRVDPYGPTRHDLDVLRGLAWSSSRSDVENRRAIDQALDVERVTRRFFVGLNEHYGKLVTELKRLDKVLPAVNNGLRRVDPKEGPERVGLRILTQTLFCYFLQRKGLLKSDPRWLSKAYNAAAKQERQFYPEVMERLFYEWLNTRESDRVDQREAAGVPFLNGGLFERLYGDVSLPLPNELFSTAGGLLGFLDGWSFTVSEDTAEETGHCSGPRNARQGLREPAFRRQEEEGRDRLYTSASSAVHVP